MGDRTANYHGEESDDDSIYGYESVEPGLPPASSDRRKWWLDNGMPARSAVMPPSNAHFPNPARPSNPFSPAPEPDWITVEKPTSPASRPSSIYSTQTKSQAAANMKSLHPEGEQGRAAQPTTFDGASDEDRLHLKQTLRKPALPPKPKLLRTESNQSTSSVRSGPPVPPPRRTQPVSSSRISSNGSMSSEPPKDTATALMDESADDELKDWEPLQPH